MSSSSIPVLHSQTPAESTSAQLPGKTTNSTTNSRIKNIVIIIFVGLGALIATHAVAFAVLPVVTLSFSLKLIAACVGATALSILIASMLSRKSKVEQPSDKSVLSTSTPTFPVMTPLRTSSFISIHSQPAASFLQSGPPTHHLHHEEEEKTKHATVTTVNNLMSGQSAAAAAPVKFHLELAEDAAAVDAKATDRKLTKSEYNSLCISHQTYITMAMRAADLPSIEDEIEEAEFLLSAVPVHMNLATALQLQEYVMMAKSLAEQLRTSEDLYKLMRKSLKSGQLASIRDAANTLMDHLNEILSIKYFSRNVKAAILEQAEWTGTIQEQVEIARQGKRILQHVDNLSITIQDSRNQAECALRTAKAQEHLEQAQKLLSGIDDNFKGYIPSLYQQANKTKQNIVNSGAIFQDLFRQASFKQDLTSRFVLATPPDSDNDEENDIDDELESAQVVEINAVDSDAEDSSQAVSPPASSPTVDSSEDSVSEDHNDQSSEASKSTPVVDIIKKMQNTFKGDLTASAVASHKPLPGRVDMAAFMSLDMILKVKNGADLQLQAPFSAVS